MTSSDSDDSDEDTLTDQGCYDLERGNQMFSFVDGDGWVYLLNATKGRRIAEKNQACGRTRPLRFEPAEHDITIEQVRSRYPSLDETYARTTDLRQPLLFIPHRANGNSGSSGENQAEPTLLLIDGWHRLMKALLTGVPELPAYLLTEQEAAAILIGKTPPTSKRP